MKQALTENKSKTAMTNELTHREAERRLSDDELNVRKSIVNIRLLRLLKNKSMIRLKQA